MNSKRTSQRRLLPCIATVALLGLTACETDIPAQFQIPGSGSLEGLIFFDASEDGVYDASDGDFGIPGLALSLLVRGTDRTIGGSETTTGADGRFNMTGLPAGTHDLSVDETTVPAGTFICQNPIPVTIFVNETEFTDIRGRPGCLITIAEAKDVAAGDFVIVRGIVTSAPDQIENGWVYIQDGSAGARIVSTALSGQGIEVGDQIEVGATTFVNAGDFELQNASLRELVEDAAVPTPLVVGTGAVATSGADFTDPIQGGFILIEGAELVASFGNAPGGNLQNGSIDDGSGTATIRIDDGVFDRNTVNTLMSVGTCYDLTGFGGNFNGAGQIFPRSVADIVEVAC